MVKEHCASPYILYSIKNEIKTTEAQFGENGEQRSFDRNCFLILIHSYKKCCQFCILFMRSRMKIQFIDENKNPNKNRISFAHTVQLSSEIIVGTWTMENIVTLEISVTDLKGPATFTSGGFEPRCFSWAHVREGVIWFHLLGCCVRILTPQSQCSVKVVRFWQDGALIKVFGPWVHLVLSMVFLYDNSIRSSRLKFGVKFCAKNMKNLHSGCGNFPNESLDQEQHFKRVRTLEKI